MWVSKKPLLCPHAVTDEEGRPLEDENWSGTRLCSYWAEIFEARQEDEQHSLHETIFRHMQKAPNNTQRDHGQTIFDDGRDVKGICARS